jgi:uncharacterized RDD family membrane protein YckC
MSNLEEMPISKKEKQYAGFWIRFAASLLDGIILSIPLTVIFFVVFFLMFASSGILDVLKDPSAMDGNISDQQMITIFVTYIIVLLVSLIVPIFYFAGMHASNWQATIGKKLLKLKVTDLQGNRISFWRGLGRYLAMVFISSIFYIGYIITAFTEKKQSLHDLIAGTVVIQDNE